MVRKRANKKRANIEKPSNYDHSIEKPPKVAPISTAVQVTKDKLEIAPDMPKITLTALSTKELESLQNMANLNATYSSLLKQQAQYDAAIAMVKIRREQIAKGELKLPVMVKVTDRLSYVESNKDKVLKLMDEDIKNIQLARDGLQGTIEYRRDSFKESLLRTISILQQKVKDEKIETIVGLTRETTPEVVEQEKEAFEKEFDKVLEYQEKEQEDLKKKTEVKKDGS